MSDDLDLVARCEKAVQEVLGVQATSARLQLYYLGVTHPDANKGTVVTTLSRFRSIPPAGIATIGDTPNDVLMFPDSGLSITTGDASPEVKKRARFVTSNVDEGFARAVENYVLGAGPETFERSSVPTGHRQ